MLDAFLEVAYQHEKKGEARRDLVALMQKLPDEELKQLVSGELKLAGYGSDCDWLDKFQGSPLYDEALELEKEKLELDIALQQQQQELRSQNDALYGARDAICLRKRILELKLREMEAQPLMEEPEVAPEMAGPMAAPAPEPAPEASPPMAEPKMAAEKSAFSITEEGHKYDAARARIKEEAALRLLALSQAYGGLDVWNDKGELEAGSVLKALRGFDSGMPYSPGDNPRHLAYVAAKHEAGSNAWNPLGGVFTPHPAEGPGARWWRYGKVDLKRTPAAKEEKKEAAEKTALKTRPFSALDLALLGLVPGIPLGLAGAGVGGATAPEGERALGAAATGLGAAGGGALGALGGGALGGAMAKLLAGGGLRGEGARFFGSTYGGLAGAPLGAIAGGVGGKALARHLAAQPAAPSDYELLSERFKEAAAKLQKEANVLAPFAALGKGLMRAGSKGWNTGLSGAATRMGMKASDPGFVAAAKNMGATTAQWAKNNPFHAAGLAGAAGVGAGYAAG